MTRPRGEVRQVLANATRELVRSSPHGGITWSQAAAHAQVGADVARVTMQNMARSGELSRVGALCTKEAKRPMTLFAPAPAEPDPPASPVFDFYELLIVTAPLRRG